jgi:cytochrome P450
MHDLATTTLPESSTSAVRLPPGPTSLGPWFGLRFWPWRVRVVAECARRYGDVFSLRVPVYGHTVVVTNPEHARQVFTASPHDVGRALPNLDGLFGSGSVFGLDGAHHLRRRRLLAPAFHGRSIKNYQDIFIEETLHATQSWPEGQEFAALPSMMQIGLKAILRTVFGAQGAQIEELQQEVPPLVTLGSRLAMMPIPRTMRRRMRGHWSPWGRFAEHRRRYDDAIDRLIDDVTADPNFDSRDDILTLLLKSRYDDGSALTRKEISDELLTLLAAGHETTGATLAWVFERITRHPQVLAKLSAEAMTEDNAYRQAVIAETQRARTVIDFVGRRVDSPHLQLGQWRIPRGTTIIVALAHLHGRSHEYPDPLRFAPERFIGERPPSFGWLPFSAGTRRCLGAVYANVEMDTVLRTVLRTFTIEPTTACDEKLHGRGVTFTPKNGARIVVHRQPLNA